MLRAIDAAALLGVETVGTFIGRHPGLSVKENVALAEQTCCRGWSTTPASAA